MMCVIFYVHPQRVACWFAHTKNKYTEYNYRIVTCVHVSCAFQYYFIMLLFLRFYLSMNRYV